ncbi:hypothetical protein HOY82DRAFT_561875 [Tuber indicum]|nr:hypothetical protein HOY82DRAFT_561875 [Tuber indicum]
MHHTQNSDPSIMTRRSMGTRQRVSRACDRCNQLRTKCDGQKPCEHCLVFGLQCEYNREQKKRGKASVVSSAKQRRSSSTSLEGSHRSSSNRIPTTPINTSIQVHDSSSSSRSPVSLPTSPLYHHMSTPGDRDCFQGDYVCMPSGTQSPQSRTSTHQQYFKQEPDSTLISFASNCINEKGRNDTMNSQQPPMFQAPDWAGSAYQPYYRGSDLFDPSKISPSSVLPINHQVLPYVPLCAGCQVNPALRLYPGSLLWLPQYGYSSGAPRNSSVSSVLEDEADACLAGRHKVVMEDGWDTSDMSGRRDLHPLDVQLGCVDDR